MTNDDSGASGARTRPSFPGEAAMQRREEAAVGYRRLQDEATRQADASVLFHVKSKHSQAAAVWAELAQAEEQRHALQVKLRRAREAEVDAARKPGEPT